MAIVEEDTVRRSIRFTDHVEWMGSVKVDIRLVPDQILIAKFNAK